MPAGSPIFSYTFVNQARTITYSHAIANLSCTLSSNDVRINTPNDWGVTQAINDINVQTKNQDLTSNSMPDWDDPGTSILMEHINCQTESEIGYASGTFIIENKGFEDLVIYGVLINKNGNTSSFIEDLTLTFNNSTLLADNFVANGSTYYFTLKEGDRTTGRFTIVTSDDDYNSQPDDVPPFPTLEIYSNDISNKPQTVVDDFGIGGEDLQSRWNIGVSWTVKPFTTE